MLDGCLKLLDVLGASFPKGGLRLTVPLFPLLRGGVYLALREKEEHLTHSWRAHTGFLPPFRFWT